MLELKSSDRDPYFDNLKGICIFLVVLGHALEWYVDDSKFILYTYRVIYNIHMPVFFFLSGYFSKSQTKVFYNTICQLLPAYVILRLIYGVLLGVTTHDYNLSLLSPVSAFWFVFALILYRLLICILKIESYKGIIICFVISLLIQSDARLSSCSLDVMRVCSYIGFFLLGYLTTPEKIKKITNRKEYLGYLIILIALLIILFSKEFGICSIYSIKYTYWIQSFQDFLGRVIYIFIAILFLVGFLIVTPKKKVWFITSWGGYSLIVYFIHIFFIGVVRIVNPFSEFYVINFMFLILVSVMITCLLSNKLVVQIYKWIFNPMSKLLSKYCNIDNT